MNYYLISQGTQSHDKSLVVKNGKTINPNNDEMHTINELFYQTQKKGNTISPKSSPVKIVKNKNNFLIEILTINTDRVNRKIPVEIFIENYSKTNFTTSDLSKTYLILESNKVIVNQSDWFGILDQIDQDLKKIRKTNSLKIFIIISIILIAISTLKVIFK